MTGSEKDDQVCFKKRGVNYGAHLSLPSATLPFYIFSLDNILCTLTIDINVSKME